MSLSWILEMPLAPFLCHLPLVPCYSVKKSLTYSFSPALLETAKVLVFFLSLVFHVFGVLILLWLHTNAAGLPKGWKTAHIFAANVCYIHSWFLIGSICTSNDRVCKVPLQIKLVPAHHLVGGWQGHVRRCLQTIHAINLFPPKWLPINCFTLTKDGLQTLNIPCLRAKSGSNCLDLLHWSYLKVSLSCGNSMSLSWILEMPLAPFLCHLPLVPCYSVKKSLTYQLFTCTPGDRKGSCFLLVLGVSRVWCFDFAVASHKCCWPSKGVKDCTHLCTQRPASSHTFPHLQSKLIGVVVLSNINNRFLCKVVLQTCATFIHGFL